MERTKHIRNCILCINDCCSICNRYKIDDRSNPNCNWYTLHHQTVWERQLTDTFGKRLQHILIDKELTKTDLAYMTGLSRVAISHICNDKCRPYASSVKKISEALDLSVENLLGEQHDTRTTSV